MIEKNLSLLDDEDDTKSKSDLNDLLCGCNGHPIAGAVCGLVSVDGKMCKAPNNYTCVYKSLADINGVLKSLDETINDARESDPEFYKELQDIFNT